MSPIKTDEISKPEPRGEDSAIALVIMPPWGEPTIPIGLGYLSETLSSHGITHEVCDFNLEFYLKLAESNKELRENWRPHKSNKWMQTDGVAEILDEFSTCLEEAVRRLTEKTIPWLGFSVNQSNARLTFETIRQIKAIRPEQRIVVGGPGVFILGERYNLEIEPGLVDMIVLGEGEQTLVNILSYDDNQGDYANIPGVIVDPYQHEYTRPTPINLKQHHWPKYQKFEVEKYPKGKKTLPLSLGRGCVCRCKFCGDHPFWGKYRSRDGRTLIDEISYHIGHFGITDFLFNDLAINCDLKELQRFCKGIVKNRLSISWSSYAFIRAMSDEDISLIARSGCTHLRFGMESGSDRVLELMNKPHRVKDAIKLFHKIHRAGIKINIGLMVGFPGETEEDVELTCEFIQDQAKKLNEIESLSLFYIKPQSYVEQHHDQFGIIFPEDHRQRWNQWTDTDGGTYNQRVQRIYRVAEAITKSRVTFQVENIYGLDGPFEPPKPKRRIFPFSLFQNR